MYLTDSSIYDRFNPEEYNNFKFWREPIIDISLDELDTEIMEKKDETTVLSQYDSFLYWRDPIPDLDDL